jgi:hypothetical protein
MSEGLEDVDVAVEMHSLLLSFAGLVDDELLGWCRELLAVGESDYALELMTATVQADRVRLPPRLHDDLFGAASRRRTLGRGETLPAPDPAPRMRHRFTVDPTEHGFPPRAKELSPDAALHRVPPRLLRDCQLWLTWRITPAGSAPGPVPHLVVLIEVLDGAGADVLAYQVAEVLSLAGTFASVEVFAADAELGDYHRAALEDANPVIRLDAEEPHGFGDGPLGEPEPHPVQGRPRADQPPNGMLRRNNGLESPTADEIRPMPPPASDEPPRRAPMHPVDRVITARGSAPRRPRPSPAERQPGSLDDVASGLNFERGAAGEVSYLGEHTDGPEESHDEPVDGPSEPRSPRERPRDSLWTPSRENGPEGVPPRAVPQAPEGPRPDGPRPEGARADGPPRLDGPRPGPDGPPRVDGPRPSGPDSARADGPPRLDGPRPGGPDGPPRVDGPRPSGPDGPRGDGPRADAPRADLPRGELAQGESLRADGPRGDDPRADRPRPDGPPRGGPERARPGRPGGPATGQFPAPEHAPGRPGVPNRGPQRPADISDTPPSGLSDVEQRLLRQLHEELAAREDDGRPPDVDQPPSRAFRSTNGNRKRPPRNNGPERTN